MAIVLTDQSNNSNDLTNSGGTEVTASLPFSESKIAVDLERSSSQYLYASDSTSLSITGDITLECWVKLETNGIVQNFISKWIASKKMYRLFVNETNKVVMAISNNGTTETTWTTDAAQLTSTGTWYHVAASVDVSGPTGIIYIGGSSVASTLSGSGTSIYDSDADFNIGAVDEGAAEFFDGVIDEVRVWNDIRSGGEISANYQKHLDNLKDASLAAYYPFEKVGFIPRIIII